MADLQDARLTDEELDNLRAKLEATSNHVPGRMAYESQLEGAIADAATAKALGWVVNWLRHKASTEEAGHERYSEFVLEDAATDLSELIEAGLERPA